MTGKKVKRKGCCSKHSLCRWLGSCLMKSRPAPDALQACQFLLLPCIFAFFFLPFAFQFVLSLLHK